MPWVDDIEIALRTLGGEANLSGNAGIYLAVSNVRVNKGIILPPNWKDCIREILQNIVLNHLSINQGGKIYSEILPLVDGHCSKLERTKFLKSFDLRLDHVIRIQAVEKLAQDHAENFYRSEAGGYYGVSDVSKRNKGWDLEATRPGDHLLVEVKGLSGPRIGVELTPNEYRQMLARDNYVVYVVTDCAEEKPTAHIFQKMENGNWEDKDGIQLKIEPKMGAVLIASKRRQKKS